MPPAGRPGLRTFALCAIVWRRRRRFALLAQQERITIDAYRGLFPHTSANLVGNFLWKVCFPLLIIAEIGYALATSFRVHPGLAAIVALLFTALGVCSQRLRTQMANFFTSAPRVLLMIGKKWSRFFTAVAAGLIERRSQLAQVKRSVAAMLCWTAVCALPGLYAIWRLVTYAQKHLDSQAYLAIVTLTALAFATLVSIVACAVDYYNEEVGLGVPGHFRLKTILFQRHPDGSANQYLGTLVHFSDLHVPGESGRLTEEGVWNAAFLTTLAARMNEIKDTQADAVFVVSGDVTDTGEHTAWRAVRHAMREFRNDIVIAPGNHDLNIVGYGFRSLAVVGDKIDWSGRWKRMAEYMHAAGDLMGARATVWCNGGMRDLALTWGAIDSADLSNNAKFRQTESLFPLIVSAPHMKGARFVVWNTVRSSSLAFNNSFGEVGDRQLDNFMAIRQSRQHTQARFIHIMHHKLALPEHGLLMNSTKRGWRRIRDAARSAVQRVGMVMHDANKVVAALRGGIDSVVLHGHHHAAFWGQIDDAGGAGGIMQVVSAPSTSLGVEIFSASAAMSNFTQVAPRTCLYEVLTIESTAHGLRLAAAPAHFPLS